MFKDIYENYGCKQNRQNQINRSNRIGLVYKKNTDFLAVSISRTKKPNLPKTDRFHEYILDSIVLNYVNIPVS